MKPSRFNLMISDPDQSDAILYNTLTGSLTALEAEEVLAAERLLQDPALDDVTVLPLRDVLIAQGNVVDDGVDELEIVQSRKRAGVRDQNRLDVVIMPTMSCNFACVYCYETHLPSRMGDDVEAALRAWLAEEVPKTKFVMLHWFGGEPLLEYKRVVSITRHLAQIAEQARVRYVVHVTTNGYLLDGDRRAALLAAGITDYQITVDGPQETHDQLRPLRNGAGSFERVRANVEASAMADPRVQITLRVNFNHTNLDVIPVLLEQFDPAVRSQLRLVLEPIFGKCEVRATAQVAAADISQAMASHYALAAEMGYDAAAGAGMARTGKLVYCYAEREHQVIFNYNGDVFKCSVGSFDSSDRMGTLRPDGAIAREGQRWDAWVDPEATFEEACLECVYLPLCMGGCRKTRLAKQGTGSYCALVPTNADHVLKQMALSGIDASTLHTMKVLGASNTSRGEVKS